MSTAVSHSPTSLHDPGAENLGEASRRRAHLPWRVSWEGRPPTQRLGMEGNTVCHRLGTTRAVPVSTQGG